MQKMPFSCNCTRTRPLLFALTTAMFMILSTSNTNTTSLAFAPTSSVIHQTPTRPRPVLSFHYTSSGDDDTKNDTVLFLETDNSLNNEVQKAPSSKNVMMVKNIPTGEIKEVPFYDPDMEANTDVTMISPWAALFFGFPTLLLLNDAFHFLPNDGLWGQVQQLFR
jgi:hypothetical protein